MKGKLVRIALTTVAALAVSAGPVLAVSVEVSGNGTDSSNTIDVTVTRTVVIQSTNTAKVSNDVSVGANTGDNQANENTGGDVSISTGDASAGAKVSNALNSNKLSLACCPGGDKSVKVSNNGADTNNKVTLNVNNTTGITTENNLDINNDFDVWANTGGNEANENTGGNVVIKTGDANALVTVDNKGNENVIVIGGLMPSPNPTPGPNPNPVPGLPTPGSVLGVSKLPNTGFDYPFALIIGASLGLIGLGVALRLSARKEAWM